MGYLIYSLVTLLGSLWMFWVLYIIVMAFYRAHLSKRLKGLVKTLALPIVLVGVLLDVFMNFTVAIVLFADIPREALVTQRLQRYKKTETGWRLYLAEYICEQLLDPFDPEGDHC